MATKTSFFYLFLFLCLNLVYAQDTTAADPKPGSSVSIEPLILHSLLKHEVAPEYPAAALQNHTEGVALVEVFVDGNGTIQKVVGKDCPKCSPVFREAAVKAVEQWQYQPILLDGKPVTVSSSVIFRFRLENGPSVEVLTKPGNSPPSAAFPNWGYSVSLDPWVLHAKLTHGAAPEYPAAALEEHTQGGIFVQVFVDGNGKVEKALGQVCPNCSPILRKAAVQAVEQWQFQPTLLNGKPVTVNSWVIFRFRLEGRSVEIVSRSENATLADDAPKLEVQVVAAAPGKAGDANSQHSSPGAVTPPEKLSISADVAERNLVNKIDPQYPQMAKIAHIQGDVIISGIINREGKIAEAKALSGHPILVQSALDAVKQWKYKPFLLNGEPVEVKTTITVRFRM
jgi:TonB family protein